MFFCGLLHSWNPVKGKGTLVGVVEEEAVLRNLGVLGARLPFRRRSGRIKRQIHEADSAVGDIGGHKTLVSQKLRIGQKLVLAACGRCNANAAPPLRFCIPDAFCQQIVGVAVSFHRTGNPQAVDIEKALRLDRHPCIFRRDVFDKALAALLAPIKDKPLVKPLFQPFLFFKALLAGHGAADVLLVNVFFCDADIIHRKSSHSLAAFWPV